MFDDIYEAITNAIIDERGTTWIMNNIIGCGWEYDEFYDFCQDLSIKAELMTISVRDRWMELADKCYEALDETDWDYEDPSFEVE